MLAGGVAWAYWTAVSAPGGHGSTAAASVDQGSTPTASAAGRTLTVHWATSTLSTAGPVDGYIVTRYDAATLTPQIVQSSCAGTVTATTCTESGVPPGQWVYSVTPVFAASWRGAESVKSSPVTVAAPSLTLASTSVRPGTSLTGTAAGFLAGETLRYRLDSPTGAELTGTLAGGATPATVPASGGGAATFTVPVGTSDGEHTVYAVASPTGDAAAATIIVDGTAPPAPVLTQTPTAVSGDSVTFAFTAEPGATLECRLDAAAFASCNSPVEYAVLSAGSHTFQARAIDTVGNVGAVASYTWTVNLAVPTIAIAFPAPAGHYTEAGLTSACGTASTGDVCGSAEDDSAVTGVSVALRHLGTGQWWNGTGFTAGAETWLAATGTADWTYPIASTALPEGEFQLRARATDGSNLGYDEHTFTVDRTAPTAPTLTSQPGATSGASATFAFTTTDPTAGFECRLDVGAWTACSSPTTYDLPHGAHTVAVRAVDRAGNTSTDTTTTWTVDATAPTGAMTFPTATTVNHTGWAAGCDTPSSGDICGTAGDVGSGLAEVAVSIRRNATNSYWDGGAFAAASEAWRTATGTTTWSALFAGTDFPADGQYTVRWRATDAVGNATTGAADVVLDTTAPITPRLVQVPPEPSGTDVQLGFTDLEAGSDAECRLDAGSWATCTSPAAYTGLGAGQHTFALRALDAAGNTSEPATHTWTVDASLPSIVISSPGAGRAYNDPGYDAGCGTGAGDICGAAADQQGDLAAVEVAIRREATARWWDGAGFNSTAQVFLPATGTTTWSYALTAAALPADGDYTVHARAIDSAGLTAIDALTFTIDRTAPPAPTITSGPTGTTGGGDTFSFTGETGAEFECRLDAETRGACTSPIDYDALQDGSHTFAVRAVDRAGNIGPETARTWTIDATGPSITATFPQSGGRYNNTGYDAGCTPATGDLCGTTSDTASAVAQVEVSLRRASTGLYLDGASFTSPTQQWITATGTTSWNHPLAATTFPADDSYLLTVRATDAVGNATTTSTTFVIDRTTPTAAGFTTTNALLARQLEQGDTFTLTYSEPINPTSVVPGWTGTAPQNVVVRATGNGGAKDKLAIYNATNTTQLPLGTLNLKRTDYVSAATTFGLTGVASTITMTGSGLTITLGTPSRALTPAAGPANVTWTPATSVTDLAGNTTATTSHTESDLDDDF